MTAAVAVVADSHLVVTWTQILESRLVPVRMEVGDSLEYWAGSCSRLVTRTSVTGVEVWSGGWIQEVTPCLQLVACRTVVAGRTYPDRLATWWQAAPLEVGAPSGSSSSDPVDYTYWS